MRTKQTIAIFGALGYTAATIARNLANGNYRLLLRAVAPGILDYLIKDIRANTPSADIEALASPTDAAWEADIIIFALPFQVEKEIAAMIREVGNQKIVICIASPLNDTFDRRLTAADTSSAEELQQLLPNSHIVKVFVTAFSSEFEVSVIEGEKVDVFMASDDRHAVAAASKLLFKAGFNPIYAGTLQISRVLENMQMMTGWKVIHN